MREIKFRAWDGYKIRYDITGFECYPNGTLDGAFLDGEYCEKNILKLMQYTGLKDKNGKEIYEGDFVIGNYIGESDYINWCEDCGGYSIFNTSLGEEGKPYCYCCGGEFQYYDFKKSIDNKEIEIIGNIYQNPELLTN